MEFIITGQHYEVRWETGAGPYGTRSNTRTFDVGSDPAAAETAAIAFADRRRAAGAPGVTVRRITIEEQP